MKFKMLSRMKGLGLALLFSALSTASADVTPCSARVDITSEPGPGPMVSALEAEGGWFKPVPWSNDKKERDHFLVSDFSVGAEWNSYSLTFTPDRDGIVKVTLRSPWVKHPSGEGLQKIWVSYANFKMEGAKESYDGLYEKNKVGAVAWRGKGKLDKNGGPNQVPSVTVWHNAPHVQKIKVKANEIVKISFDARCDKVE